MSSTRIKAIQLVAVGMLFGFSTATAQNNLVENPGFDETEKKVRKGVGEIELATGWYSPDEENPADLFSGDVKKEYGQPENIKGYQLPESGSNYAGIRVWQDRGSEPITYIQTKLKDELIEGKKYCISFKVSLADLSKYGNANIGANISAKKPRSRDLEDFEVKANIQHSKKKVFKDTYLWETICSIYEAKGDERYLTIGGFVNPETMDEKEETERLRLSAQFRGQRQTSDSYFFIEDVSVINMEELESCICEEGDADSQMDVVYSEQVGETDEDIEPSTAIEAITVYFDENSDVIKSNDDLNEVVNLMINNPELKLTVIGHTDKGEEMNSSENLSKKRAEAVVAYLKEMGVMNEKIEMKAMKDQDMVNESGSKMGKAKNRRVQFEVMVIE